MSALYILKTGSTLPALAGTHGDFEDWVARGLGDTPLAIEVLDARACTQPDWQWPAREQMAGLVITGSHEMVTSDAPWITACSNWLLALAQQNLPMLGICFGHQLLAQTLGGQVAAHPAGLELGTVAIEVLPAAADDPLWHDLPPQFHAHTVHYQSVRRLPAEATLLAANPHDPCHGFRWGPHLWGVQFHPEFDTAVMQAYVNHVQSSLQTHALDAENWPVQHTPWSARLLQRFARYAQDYRMHRAQPFPRAA